MGGNNSKETLEQFSDGNIMNFMFGESHDEKYQQSFNEVSIPKYLSQLSTQFPTENDDESVLIISEGPIVTPRNLDYKQLKLDISHEDVNLQKLKSLLHRTLVDADQPHVTKQLSESEMTRQTLARLMPMEQFDSVVSSVPEQPDMNAKVVPFPRKDEQLAPIDTYTLSDKIKELNKFAEKISEPSTPEVSDVRKNTSTKSNNDVSVSVNEFLKPTVGKKFPVELTSPDIPDTKQPIAKPTVQPIQLVQQPQAAPTIVIAPMPLQTIPQMQPTQPVQPAQKVISAEPVKPIVLSQVYEKPLNDSLSPGVTKPKLEEPDKKIEEHTISDIPNEPKIEKQLGGGKKITSESTLMSHSSEVMNLLPFSSSSGGASDYYRSMQNALRYT